MAGRQNFGNRLLRTNGFGVRLLNDIAPGKQPRIGVQWMNLEVPVFIQIFHYFAREIVEEPYASCCSAVLGLTHSGRVGGRAIASMAGSSSRWVVARNRTADTLARGGRPWCTKCAGRVAAIRAWQRGGKVYTVGDMLSTANDSSEYLVCSTAKTAN